LKHVPSDLIYSSGGEKRIFDFRRYRHSKMLPDIIKQLDKKKCYLTKKRKWLIIESLPSNALKIGYKICFGANKLADGSLRLFIQNAYIGKITPYIFRKYPYT
jgi:hypothetical protein